MYYNWTVPNVVSGQCKIRVTQGSSQSESVAPFTIIGVPQNLQVDWACVDSFQLSWSPVSGATQYEVSMLGQKYMDSVDVTTATQYVFHNTINTQEYWVSVKALGNNGIVGRRAIAINKQPGTFNCPIPYDIAIEQIFPYQAGEYGQCVMASLKPIVKVKNEGMSSVSSIPIAYKLNNGAVINEIVPGTINAGDSIIYQFSNGTAAILGNNALQIYVTYAGDGNPYNDTLSLNFNVTNNAALAYSQYIENFENQSLCSTTSDCESTTCALTGNWSNLSNLLNDDIDWRVNTGSTPSSNTGPANDYNPGTTTGKYIYTEASASCNYKRAILQSSCIDLSATQLPVLNFAYHMYGIDMGSLQVNVISADTFSTIFSIADDQGDFWFPETVSLTDFKNQTIQIQFVATTGGNYRSDMALDDISLSDMVGLEENESGKFNLFPNPANDVLNIVSETKITEINLTDVTGKIVGVYLPTSLKVQIPVNHLANGLYFVTLKGEDYQQTYRLIINNN
jgi:hypothetical protein